jgi:hypothetical protein
MPVKGIDRVKRNFRVVIKNIEEHRTHSAIYAVLSQGAALAQTMTPMNTSNLVNSQYAPQISNKKGKTSGQVGYTAAYAAAVHNAPGTLKGLPRLEGRGKYWDPKAEPQFLKKGFEQIKPQIPAILEDIYRV